MAYQKNQKKSQYSKEEKARMNRNKITEYKSMTRDGKFRLVDFHDGIHSIYNGVPSKKITVNVNSKEDGKPHANNQVAAYPSVEFMLFAAYEIKMNQFPKMDYGVTDPRTKQPKKGSMIYYGGMKQAYSLEIEYVFFKEKHWYKVTVAVGEKKPDGVGFNGNPTDTHSVMIPFQDMRRMMVMLETHITASLSNISFDSSQNGQAPVNNPSSNPKTEEKDPYDTSKTEVISGGNDPFGMGDDPLDLFNGDDHDFT